MHKPFVPPLICGQSQRSPSHKIKDSFSKQDANSHLNMRVTLGELLRTWILRPLLPVLKCLCNSLSQKTHVQVNTCCTGVHVIAIHAETELNNPKG